MSFTLSDQNRTVGLHGSHCRSMLASDLVSDIPANAKRFFKAEVLSRWTDLSPEEVTTLNAGRDELISFLQQRYGFGGRRAASEADSFIAHVRDRVRLATEISAHPSPTITAADQGCTAAATACSPQIAGYAVPVCTDAQV